MLGRTSLKVVCLVIVAEVEVDCQACFWVHALIGVEDGSVIIVEFFSLLCLSQDAAVAFCVEISLFS